jgi:ubiquitin-conjugating enzyme E2 J1
MSTVGQFSTKNTTIKRILKEASELSTKPSADFVAAPLETDLFEWHFTLRGPPAPSPFENGIYHGRIVLPAAYPMKPPSFRFLTPTGRFEVNREICLSISGHHEETWQPAWGIRTALVAIRSFMDTDARGQLGGMDSSEEVRKRLANQSKSWKCSTCGKTNEAIMKEQEELVKEKGGQSKVEEVPEELRLAYREDLSTTNGDSNKTQQKEAAKSPQQPAISNANIEAERTATSAPQQTQQQPPPLPARGAQAAQPNQMQQRRQDEEIPSWIDKAIYAILAVLAYLLWKKIGS